MGRETKILLGFLGLLAGVFMGVLSMKLFVPRPPAGAGPDIHTELAATEPHDIVEPPRLTMRASDFAAAPPLVPAAMPADAGIAAAPPAAGDRYAAHDGGFARDHGAAVAEAEPEPLPRRDPFVAAASFEQPGEPGAASPPFEASPPDQADEPHQPIPLADGPPPETRPAALAGDHVAQPGETWWSLAERAYGDGRLYRALYAWNRARDPRITLAPGTPLRLPPLADLAAAWPHLMPARP